jgi:hypothetical protein
MAFAGVLHVDWLRAAFALSGVVYAAWAIASFATFLDGTTSALPGALLLAKWAGLNFLLVGYAFREQRIVAETAELGAVVEKTKAAREQLLDGT